MVTRWTTAIGRLAAISSAIALTQVGVPAQNAAYSVTDLGTLGGRRSAALGINNAGHVVGSSETADGRTHAFVYLRTALVDLGTFGGRDSYAYRISDGDLIVGRASTAAGEFRPFVSSATGASFDLSEIDSRLTGVFSTAVDVNRTGYIVGYRQTHHDHMAARNRVFIYRDFQVVDLGAFGGEDGVATAINDAGHLVGYFSTQPHADYADHRGFLLDGNGLTDLGSLGGRMTTPTDINDSSQVVGYAQIRSGENRGFIYSAGTLTDIGTLAGGSDSRMFAINDRGQAVGSSDSAAGARAVIFSNGELRDLNDLIPGNLGWTLVEARDINDAGQIVGTGVVAGHLRAFLLTPASAAR